MRSTIPPLRRPWFPLVVESARVAAANVVVSAIVGLLTMTILIVVLGTAGLNIANQAEILQRLDDVGARILTLVSVDGEPVIPAAAVDRIARLAGVDWVLGLGPVSDVRNRTPSGDPTPMRVYRIANAPVGFGPAASPGARISVLSAARLGLDGAYSVLDPGGIPVVGWFDAEDPLENLESFVLVLATSDEQPLERAIISVADVGWVEPVATALSQLIGNSASGGATVERSQALLAAREAVRTEVARGDRLLVGALVGAGVSLGSAVVSAGTLANRRDFGRRRALGATRIQLTVLVMLQTLWPSIAGALLGLAVGFAYLWSQLGRVPSWQFPTSLALLTILALVTASAAPAGIAAGRDPLRVLRVP